MKKSFKILTLIMFIITIWQISVTYAKFYTEAHASFEENIGNWIIKVNNTDIYSEDGQNVNFVLDEFYYEQSAYTPENKIAPGKTGYCDIVIDPTRYRCCYKI